MDSAFATGGASQYKTYGIVVAIIVLLLLILFVAYYKCWLNPHIPTSWAKSGCSTKTAKTS